MFLLSFNYKLLTVAFFCDDVMRKFNMGCPKIETDSPYIHIIFNKRFIINCK